MLRKGFTLIELLIVITIIAILAGAALPYVQDYLEDARLAKAKADLDEIKNALIRYELDTGILWSEENISKLVGPYLAKALTDPWGVPYVIDPVSSVAYSCGPDRAATSADPTATNNADNIYADFRPPLALSRAYWIDADKDGTVNANDQLKIRFTRAPNPAHVTTGNLLATGDAGPSITIGSVNPGSDPRDFIMNLTAASFVPGRDFLYADSAKIFDKATLPATHNASKQNLVLINSL